MLDETQSQKVGDKRFIPVHVFTRQRGASVSDLDEFLDTVIEETSENRGIKESLQITDCTDKLKRFIPSSLASPSFKAVCPKDSWSLGSGAVFKFKVGKCSQLIRGKGGCRPNHEVDEYLKNLQVQTWTIEAFTDMSSKNETFKVRSQLHEITTVS